MDEFWHVESAPAADQSMRTLLLSIHHFHHYPESPFGRSVSLSFCAAFSLHKIVQTLTVVARTPAKTQFGFLFAA
jgi:hypothetical protein